MRDYRGKVAVVTGASAGLGRRLALDLSSAGAVVVGVARREERLVALVDEMRTQRAQSSYRVCDLSEASSFVRLLDQVEEEYGRIDILANIAGVSGIMRAEPTTAASLRSIMEVNFIAPVAGMMAVLSGMRKRKSGAIANMSSDDGRAPGPGAAAYCASKAALSAATESLSYEARPDGVFLHVLSGAPSSKSRRWYFTACMTHGWRSMQPCCRSSLRFCAQWPHAPIKECGPPGDDVSILELAFRSLSSSR